MVLNGLKIKTISALFWKLLERGGRACLELILQIILARLLAPDQFGALAIMLVFINVGNVIVQSGLNTAIVQSPNIDDRDCSTVFWLSFVISVLLYAVVFICAPLIASFYAMPILVWPLRVLCLILVVNSFNSIQIAIVQRNLEFNKLFRSSLTSALISGITGIILAMYGAGLWALVIQQVFTQVFNCLFLYTQVRWFPKIVFDNKRAVYFFSYGWKLLVSGLLNRVYESLSDLIIGKQFSASTLGLVSQGKKYPQAIGSLLDGAIQPVMLSAVAHVQDDLNYVKRLVRRALKTSTYLIVPCMTLFTIVAEPIVRLLLGEQWLPAVPFLQMYCFMYALLPIHTSNLQALNGMGRSDLFLKLEIVKKVYGFAFIFLGAFVFHNVYVLIGSYMVSGVISTFVNAWPNKKVIGYSYFEQIKDICPAFILAIISAVVTLPVDLLALSDIVTIFLQAVVFATVYLGLSKLFKVEAFDYLLSTVKEMVF